MKTKNNINGITESRNHGKCKRFSFFLPSNFLTSFAKIKYKECANTAASARRTRRSLAQKLKVVLSLGIICLSTILNPAYAAFQGKNGRIAFVSDRPGGSFPNIYTMNPDGSDLVQLTSGQRSNQYPAWSADGQKIVFASNRNTELTTRTFQIYVMNADGSNQTRITNCEQDTPGAHSTRRGCTAPEWSPDGKKITFGNRAQNGFFELYIMDADGSNMQPLTVVGEGIETDFRPRFTRDGKHILVTANNHPLTFPDFQTINAVYIVDVDGKNLRQYTADSVEGFNGDLKPNNSRIAFMDKFISVGLPNIYLGKAKTALNGANFTPVTTAVSEQITTDGYQDEASYSPDGHFLVIGREAGVTVNDVTGQTEIYTVDLRGPKPYTFKAVTDNQNKSWRDTMPDWQPLPKDDDSDNEQDNHDD